MLHVATVHHGTPRWIEIQVTYLRRHLNEPFQTWAVLGGGIDPSYGAWFDHVLDSRGTHAARLNHLALEISAQAAEDDLLMFLDSDAFPIADPMPLIRDGLSRAALLAVRRAENGDEPQPHPSFCVTTVGAWRRVGGDWCSGPTWVGPNGKHGSDVGAQLWRRLELSNTPWVEVLRSNRTNLDPLYFGVYGDVIYHHGAGSRDRRSGMGNLSPVHRVHALPAVRAGNPILRGALKLSNGLRWRMVRRATERNVATQSERMYEQIRSADASDWVASLI